ncbi:MAG: hypothetical protein KKC75_02970 [Nanoarchaeota archaeon]|nr:hypothetical protein [Nanoarchaeota archaeon]MBU1005641.1 hypothetical protein [Nanoarchaeota archaeon]MBU1945846.1 hypothetical protein [Nanoarchaeota archaeon]
MGFSKTFPKTVEGSTYPRWEEIFLTSEEEKDVEQKAKEENIELMKECIDDAKRILEEKGFKGFKEDMLAVAIPLFEKRASHIAYWKESKCKERFDELNK